MDSVDIEVLRSVEEWRKAGRRATLGTIVSSVEVSKGTVDT